MYTSTSPVCKDKYVDVIFAIDSSDNLGPMDLWYQKKFVRDFAMGMDIGPEKSRVGVVFYTDYVRVCYEGLLFECSC